MTITPEDKELLTEIDKAIELETKLLPVLDCTYRSSYSREDDRVATIRTLRDKRCQLLFSLIDSRLLVINAAARLIQ